MPNSLIKFNSHEPFIFTRFMAFIMPIKSQNRKGDFLMTNEQKEIIYKLRLEGMGYKSISKQLDLSRDSVKAYCTRHHLNGPSQLVELNLEVIKEKHDLCQYCSNPIRKKGKGRTRKFCSEECRRKWWIAHPEERNLRETATYHYICPRCHKSFSAYGNHKRKYCSHQCYIKDRFGEEQHGI